MNNRLQKSALLLYKGIFNLVSSEFQKTFDLPFKIQNLKIIQHRQRADLSDIIICKIQFLRWKFEKLYIQTCYMLFLQFFHCINLSSVVKWGDGEPPLYIPEFLSLLVPAHPPCSLHPSMSICTGANPSRFCLKSPNIEKYKGTSTRYNDRIRCILVCENERWCCNRCCLY
jgi:hypothetical protein